MPKTKTNYQNKISLNISDKMLMALENARRSEGAKKGFGVVPTRTEFIRGVLYYWMRKNAPEILELNGDIPEVLEHKKLKRKYEEDINILGDITETYLNKRKSGDIKFD
jgi:hypothetical protein